MSKSFDPWQDGRRAWKRLSGWQDDGASAGHPDDGDAALAALTDVGAVHRILDQFELIAVRTARRHGKSWAEIATRLGVTRQSAWERWRDLDNPETPTGGGSGRDDAIRAAVAGATAELALGFDSPSAIRARSARSLRRSSSILVPNVIGMTWADARRALAEKALIAIEPGAARPPTADEVPSGPVTDQSPESGARVVRRLVGDPLGRARRRIGRGPRTAPAAAGVEVGAGGTRAERRRRRLISRWWVGQAAVRFHVARGRTGRGGVATTPPWVATTVAQSPQPPCASPHRWCVQTTCARLWRRHSRCGERRDRCGEPATTAASFIAERMGRWPPLISRARIVLSGIQYRVRVCRW